MRSLNFYTFLPVLAICAITAFANAATAPVKEILPADLLESELYKIDPEARLTKSIATFVVTSRHGQREVQGVTGLEEHIAELVAIEQLERMKKTGVYKDAVKNSALGPWNTAKGLVSEPVTTVKESVKGFGGYIADIGYSVFSKDPSQENVAKTTLGFATAKRQLAYELGVNPYTGFEPLQDALGEVAWTTTGGGLTVTVLFGFVKDVPGVALRVSKTANTARKLVRDLSPRKLAKRNEERLLAMGLNAVSVEALMDNYYYDPEAKTRLVVALESLEDAKGLQELVYTALIASSPEKAQLVRDWVEFLATYNDSVRPVSEIVSYGATPFVLDADGNVYGVFLTDYSVADERIKTEIAAVSETIRADGHKLAAIYATGIVEPEVESALTEAGWSKVFGEFKAE